MAFTEFERDTNATVGVMWEHFVTAVGIFVYTNEEVQKPCVKVDDIAMAFNTTPDLAREAAEDHPWLYVHDDGTVQSDGE